MPPLGIDKVFLIIFPSRFFLPALFRKKIPAQPIGNKENPPFTCNYLSTNEQIGCFLAGWFLSSEAKLKSSACLEFFYE
jgi:hypothetical protein